MRKNKMEWVVALAGLLAMSLSGLMTPHGAAVPAGGPIVAGDRAAPEAEQVLELALVRRAPAGSALTSLGMQDE